MKFITPLYAVDIFPEEHKRCRKAHEEQMSSKKPKRGEKCCLGMDLRQEELWHGPKNVDTRMIENIQNIR